MPQQIRRIADDSAVPCRRQLVFGKSSRQQADLGNAGGAGSSRVKRRVADLNR
jgi:hypothetical protein